MIISLGIQNGEVNVKVSLKNKQASPFIEYGDLYFKTNCVGKKFTVKKIDYELDVIKDVVENANNILYCVSDSAKIDEVEINPIDTPLVSFGSGSIFKFKTSRNTNLAHNL